MKTYKFYIQTINKDGTIPEESIKKNIEADFVGLRYKECVGLNAIGKPRVYTESYANSDKIRAYVPQSPLNEPTDIKLTLYFTGESRQATFDAFNEFICGGFRRYWDSARYKSFDFFVKDKIEISDEMWYGSLPYFEVTYTLQNLKGKTTNKEIEEDES